MRMCEAVVCVEEDMEVETEEVETQKEDARGEVVRWEKFLPRMALRVLLVEADDSTRQIIAALLRKCSYKGLFFHSVSHYFFSYCFTLCLCLIC